MEVSQAVTATVTHESNNTDINEKKHEDWHPDDDWDVDDDNVNVGKRLPTRIITARQQSEEKKGCLICKTQWTVDDVAVILPCLHSFHKKCVMSDIRCYITDLCIALKEDISDDDICFDFRCNVCYTRIFPTMHSSEVVDSDGNLLLENFFDNGIDLLYGSNRKRKYTDI